jgi:hypothetical protein
VPLPNHARVRGRVNGGIDSRDLFRFDVRRRSALLLRVTGKPQITLVRDDGHRLASGDVPNLRIGAGRYYVAVEGSGRYTLTRSTRVITHAALAFNGRQRSAIDSGESARLALRLHPRVSGRGEVIVQRRDPIEGWQFVRRYRMRVREGIASVRFEPSSLGNYRAIGDFLGTRTAAPDEARMAWLHVR